LLRLKASGVLLVLCSKNNEADAVKVFESHPDMVLRMTDFVAHRINWTAKSENIKSMAEELSLGVDSFVFFDDTAFERQQMQQLLPAVDVIEVPADASHYVQALADYQGFDILRATAEDSARSAMYQAESSRKKLQSQSSSLEEFYVSLAMEAECLPVDEPSISRVHQLLHKTNQFNLTTQRHTEQHLREMVFGKGSPYEAYCLRLKDKLGENGITGVVIVKKSSTHWELDSFLLSCRIIGRTVEYSLIRWLGQRALKAGAKTLRARYVPTAKNQVAAPFLSQAGFTLDNETQQWNLNLEKLDSAVPRDYVTLKGPQ
jgi:FkbH-like protein